MYKKISLITKNVFQNYFELAVMFSALVIILAAILMDQFMYLQACALCILTRYVFGLVAIAGLLGYLIKKQFISALLISASSLMGMYVTSRQIYIQSMSIDELANLSGCGMPFHAQVDYFGLTEAVTLEHLQAVQVVLRMVGDSFLILQSMVLYFLQLT